MAALAGRSAGPIQGLESRSRFAPMGTTGIRFVKVHGRSPFRRRQLLSLAELTPPHARTQCASQTWLDESHLQRDTMECAKLSRIVSGIFDIRCATDDR